MSTPIGNTAPAPSAEGNGAPDHLPARALSKGAEAFLAQVHTVAADARLSIAQLVQGHTVGIAAIDGLNTVAKRFGYEPTTDLNKQPEHVLRWLETQLGELVKLRNEAGPF